MRWPYPLLLPLLLTLPASAQATTLTANVTLSVAQSQTQGCNLSDSGTSGAFASLSDGDTVGSSACTNGFVPQGSYSMSGSAGAAVWSLGVVGTVSGAADAAGNLDGLSSLASATFMEEMTITLPGLAQGDPIQVSFDYEFDGICSTSGGYGCSSTYRIQVFSNTLLSIITVGGAFQGETAKHSWFNGFEFTVRGSLFTDPAGGGSTGSATGSFGNTGRLVGLHVYDSLGAEFAPSEFSVTTTSGTLPIPEPSVLVLLVCTGLAGLASRGGLRVSGR